MFKMKIIRNLGYTNLPTILASPDSRKREELITSKA